MENTIEYVFDEWKKKSNIVTLKSANPKENKLHIDIDGQTITLTYPSPDDVDGIFFVEQNPNIRWINDLNDYALSNSLNWKDFFRFLETLESYAQPKHNIQSSSLQDSTDALKSSRDDDDEISQSQEMDLPFRINFQELSYLLQQAVHEAEILVGKDTARFYDDSGTVSVRIDMEQIISDELAIAMDLTNQEPVVVTLNFQKRSFKDFNTAPTFSVSQRTKKDSWGIKFHLKQIVQTYIQDNWKGEVSLAVSSHPPATPTVSSSSSSSSTTISVDKSKVNQLKDFGFSEDLCNTALEMTNNDTEAALDKLLNNSVTTKKAKTTPTRDSSVNNNAAVTTLDTKFSEQVAMFTELGFDSQKAKEALHQTSGNWDSAMDMLVSGNIKPQKNKNTKKRGRNQAELQYNPLQQGLSLQSSNFFVKLIAYVRARLHNYTSYCIICQKKHACNSKRPVVCCTALCQFRYQDLRFGQLVDGCNVCAFSDCRGQDELAANEEVVAAIVACKDTGLPDEILLDMFRHKYLPNEDLLKFIEQGVKGQNVKVAHIENVLKPELVARYELKWEKMKRQLGENVVKPEMVYHGTAPERLSSILEKGLLVPGKNNSVTHATDTGIWGKGIYLSPNAAVSVGYCRGGSKLLICSVLMGRRFKCSQTIVGQPVQPGYDSHVAPSDQEWIVFGRRIQLFILTIAEEDQVLPCYVVDFNFNRK